jgi:hypothetical protein
VSERTGSCLCGAVRYEILTEPAAVAVCHCTHCQRQSGAVFSTNLLVPEAAYRQHGETKIYRDSGDSGKPVYRHFCERCGSPVTTRADSIPGMVIVKAGTLDDGTGLTPTVEVYADHAAAWMPAIAGAQRFGQAPA